MEILVKDDPVFRNIHQKYIDFSTEKKIRMAYEAREKNAGLKSFCFLQPNGKVEKKVKKKLCTKLLSQ